MRQRFHEDLDRLVSRLTELVSVVGQSMRRATVALLGADGPLAVAVLIDDADIAERHRELDDLAVDILARQQPVATDLRTVVACLRMSVDLRRMGKLAVHVAEIARRHAPDVAVPAEVRPALLAMADIAEHLVGAAGRALVNRDAAAAAGLDREDDELDLLQQQLYGNLFVEPRRLDTDTVVEIALLGRYYERFADHAVTLARDVAYVAGRRALDAAPAET